MLGIRAIGTGALAAIPQAAAEATSPIVPGIFTNPTPVKKTAYHFLGSTALTLTGAETLPITIDRSVLPDKAQVKPPSKAWTSFLIPPDTIPQTVDRSALPDKALPVRPPSNAYIQFQIPTETLPITIDRQYSTPDKALPVRVSARDWVNFQIPTEVLPPVLRSALPDRGQVRPPSKAWTSFLIPTEDLPVTVDRTYLPDKALPVRVATRDFISGAIPPAPDAPPFTPATAPNPKGAFQPDKTWLNLSVPPTETDLPVGRQAISQGPPAKPTIGWTSTYIPVDSTVALPPPVAIWPNPVIRISAKTWTSTFIPDGGNFPLQADDLGQPRPRPSAKDFVRGFTPLDRPITKGLFPDIAAKPTPPQKGFTNTYFPFEPVKPDRALLAQQVAAKRLNPGWVSTFIPIAQAQPPVTNLLPNPKGPTRAPHSYYLRLNPNLGPTQRGRVYGTIIG